MKLLVFTIYDEKSQAYLQPFYLTTTGQAIRAITDCVSDPNHAFGIHPADYTLFQLGTFDNSTGHFTPGKLSLGNLIEYTTYPIEKEQSEKLAILKDAIK